MLSAVTRSLTDMTSYVAKLREKMKIQTRKNYMRGTNNLLTYIINEFMVDYAKMNSSAFEDSVPAGFSDKDTAEAFNKVRDQLRSVRAAIASRDVNATEVVEYCDKTEYCNISAETSLSALDASSKTPNARFWEENSSGDGLGFKLAEIDRFYLETLGVKDSVNKLGHAIEFLSGIYDIGADKSFVDPRTGIFVTEILAPEHGGDNLIYRYSNAVYADLSALSSAYGKFNLFMESADYEYDSAAPVSAQIEGAF